MRIEVIGLRSGLVGAGTMKMVCSVVTSLFAARPTNLTTRAAKCYGSFVRSFSEDAEAQRTLSLVQGALTGDRAAVRELIGTLLPVIRRRVAISLARYARDAEAELEDVCQEVLLGLFRDDRGALAAWDPKRGLSLSQFVGMLAQRRVISHLRSRASKSSRHTLTEPEHLERLLEQSTNEQLDPHNAALDTLHELADRLRISLSPLGLEMFYRLYVWEQPTEEIAAQLELSSEAIYQWRSRIKKAAALAWKDLGNEP